MGASIGGMQALEMAIQFPELVERVVSIGATPLGSMGLGLNHLQRQMIQLDPAWKGGHYPPDEPPREGLALARALAVCTYKSAELFEHRFARRPDRSGEDPWALHERGQGLRPAIRCGRIPRLPGRKVCRALRRERLPGHDASDGYCSILLVGIHRRRPHSGASRRR